jgi:hypothetical protein
MRELPAERDEKGRRAMDLQLRNFPLVFTLAFVTPALGQAVAPTVGPAFGGSESAESIPDFSGFWVHPLPGFEPLTSGPTAGQPRAPPERHGRHPQACRRLHQSDLEA